MKRAARRRRKGDGNTKEYEHDKATVDAWLCNGGAEIVLEVLRRMGWSIEVLQGDEWPWVDDVVVVADREDNTMSISGAKSPRMQAMFAVAVAERKDPLSDKDMGSVEGMKNWLYPMFRESDKFTSPNIYLCYSFIDQIRISSETTIACIGAMKTAQAAQVWRQEGDMQQ